jgi:hypothetical protein
MPHEDQVERDCKKARTLPSMDLHEQVSTYVDILNDPNTSDEHRNFADTWLQQFKGSECAWQV